MRVGTSSYCQVCGGRLPGPRALDLRPAAQSNGPALAMPTDRTAKPAAALHARTTPANGRVLDLRKAAPGNPAAPVRAAAPAIDRQASVSSAKIVAAPNHQGAIPAAPPKTTAKERHLARFEDRFQHAQSVERSIEISKFNRFDRSNRFGGSRLNVVVPAKEQSAPAYAPRQELPKAAAAQHAAMAQMAGASQIGHSASGANTGWRPHLSLAPSRGQYAAIAAAVVIMGGYIWLQNYPKMAIQSAGNKAGIGASLPAYVPSSYVLAGTRTAPGLVTLDFTSPSQAGKLTIAQHRTTWDSTSLLDQYIATKTPDYTAVQGQGLTVYLYGQNQAAWVNHGVWYSIEGATRLSRDQILKIAYSL